MSSNPRLIGWICEWLDEVAVREPKTLRDQVEEAAGKGLQDRRGMGSVSTSNEVDAETPRCLKEAYEQNS